MSVVFEILPLLSRHFYRNRLGVTSLREGVGDMAVCDRCDKMDMCWLSLLRDPMYLLMRIPLFPVPTL